MKKVMLQSQVVETLEMAVPVVGGSDLLFRVEVLSVGSSKTCQYRCRLYRLENFRFEIPNSDAMSGKKREFADYRSWVVDDNLGIDIELYQSAAKAKRGALLALKTQLGF